MNKLALTSERAIIASSYRTCVFPWNQIISKTTGIGQALCYQFLFILSLFNNSDGKFISYVAVLRIMLSNKATSFCMMLFNFNFNRIGKALSSVP